MTWSSSGDESLELAARAAFHVMACSLVLEEGFEVHTRKSHFMRQGVRQQVAGVVLNVRPNVRRDEFDRLKATLTNCVRHGPHEQNRRTCGFPGPPAGRIAYLAMLNLGARRTLAGAFRAGSAGRTSISS